MKKLSVIIPAFNEARTVAKLLEAVMEVRLDALELEVIIVDDGSNDGTSEILTQSLHPIKLLSHKTNQGKGAAIRTAQPHTTGDFVLIQDADLEYDPREYRELLRPLLEERADVVYGSRLSGGKPTRAFKIAHLIGNKFLSTLTNLLYNSTLTDMETCYKVFRGDLFRSIVIRSNRFDFEPEITAKMLKKKIRLYEMPISYYGRDYEEGKKITWIDGLAAIAALIRFRFSD